MRSPFVQLLRVGILVAGILPLSGCAWHHHPHKPNSYDRSVTDEDHDPTYQENSERADLEVHNY